VTDIQRCEGTHLARASSWAGLADEELRKRAVVAAHNRDSAELWSLAEAFLTLHGPSGSRMSRHTLRMYRRGVVDLVDAWQGENLLRPSRDAGSLYVRQLESAVSERTGKPLAVGTIRVRLAAAQLLYKALRWAGATTAVPFDNTSAPRDPTPAWEKRQPYGQEALERLLAVAEPGDRVLVLLGAHAGLRVAEIVNLRWSDVDLPGQKLTVTGKGNKRGTVEMSSSLKEALEVLERAAPGEIYVMPYRSTNRARQRFEALCERAGVPYLGVHSLRHYSGTRVARETSLEDTQRHLRHASITTTQSYAKWQQEGLRKTVGSW
jgi:integrase